MAGFSKPPWCLVDMVEEVVGLIMRLLMLICMFFATLMKMLTCWLRKALGDCCFFNFAFGVTLSFSGFWMFYVAS